MRANDIILASLFLLFPLKSSADYLGQISLNGKEKIVEKDDSNKQIRLDCKPGDEAMELSLRAFIEEERENLENETYSIINKMSDLTIGSYTNSREDANKLEKMTNEVRSSISKKIPKKERAKIEKLKIPDWTFAFDKLNPKLLVLEKGAKQIYSNIDILQKTEEIEGKTYGEYSAVYNKIVKARKRARATSDLIEDIRKATEIPFIFTNDEIDGIKDDLRTWDIKSLELLAIEKLNELKKIREIKEKKWNEIEKTPEYKKYLDKISESEKQIYLSKWISENYKLKIAPPEISKKDSFPIVTAYSSNYEMKLGETSNLETRIEKVRINEDKYNARIWMFAEEWNKKSPRFQDYYFLKFHKSVLVVHPKGANISNIIEKSYNLSQEDSLLYGKWETNFSEEKNEEFGLNNKIRKFLANEAISAALKGWIIRTKNVAEWITWKMREYEKSDTGGKKSKILDVIKDYEITEISLSPTDKQYTAKYLGFNVSNAKGNVYILIGPRIEKGEVSNLSYGELEALISLDKRFDKEEYFKDKHTDEKTPNVIRSNEFLDENEKRIEEDEIMAFMNEKRDYYFKMNSNLKKYDIIKINRTGKGTAEVTIEEIVDFPNPNFNLANRYEANSKMYLKKIDKDGKKVWSIDKTGTISTKEYPVIPGTGFDLSVP
jgi:hypothetical protein